MSLRKMKRQVMRNEKEKYKKMVGEMSLIEINKRLLQHGIGQADIDKARHEGLQEGFTEAGKMMTRTCYAAAIRVLKRDFGFEKASLVEFLKNMDVMTLTVLDHQEMVEETLEETGIRITLDEGVDRVQEISTGKALCEDCPLGTRTAPGAFDCDALDGTVAGRKQCAFYPGKGAADGQPGKDLAV